MEYFTINNYFMNFYRLLYYTINHYHPRQSGLRNTKRARILFGQELLALQHSSTLFQQYFSATTTTTIWSNNGITI